MDFIVKLPELREPATRIIYDITLVIIDWLTKYTYFVLYQEKATVEDLAYIVEQVLLGNH